MAKGILAELQHLAVPIDSLNTYHKNPRRRDNVEDIKESLVENGQYRGLVVNVGTHTGRPNEIAGGNHTYQAAFELGWKEIAATWVDLDEVELAKIVAVDNRSNDQAWYDEAELAELLGVIAVDDPTLVGTGYTVDDLEDLYMKLEPPTMDALEAEFGTPTDEDTWPTIRLPVPRELFNRFTILLGSFEGEPHEQLSQIVDAATP